MIKLWSLLLLETNRKIVKNTVKGSTAQRIRLYKDTKTLWLVFLYLNSSSKRSQQNGSHTLFKVFSSFML